MVTIKLTFIGALLFASFGCGGRSAPRVSLLREIPPGKYEVTYNLVGSKIETKFQLAVTSLPLSNQNNIYVGNVPFQNRIWSFDLGNFDNSATLLSDFNEIYITFVI